MPISVSYIVDKLLPERKLQSSDYLDNGKEKLTVCIELDDTFLFVYYPDEFEGYLNQPMRDHDYYIDFPEFNTFLNIYMRKGHKEFFEYLKNNTEAVVFSTGSKQYVDAVLNILDPNYEVFKHRLYQTSCNLVDYKEEDLTEFVKDLDSLNRNLSRTVLIDTKPFSFWCNPDSCVPIKPYNGNGLEDNELEIITQILRNLEDSPDVRFDLAESYGIRDTLKESNLL